MYRIKLRVRQTNRDDCLGGSGTEYLHLKWKREKRKIYGIDCRASSSTGYATWPCSPFLWKMKHGDTGNKKWKKKTLNFVWLKSFLLRFRRLEITKSIKLNCWVVLKDLVIRFSFSSKHHSQECWRAEGEEGTIDEFRNRNERLSLNNKETKQFQMKNKW